ncbi:uncharacterized protein LOC131950988 isoform X2 [Physella acuta]|uniref:uncharacterized protein LOC131950988 isoform X2 n=1 Tax=Physella acuta TaxID=109671 RepID=UPI0027DBA6D9|nr:uncharacterized protein LOC131950988 isoform X2 [Physella acuta]
MTCPGLVTVCSTLIFLTVITHGAGRETYTSKDGRTFYIDPVLCESVYTDVFAENDLIKHQKVYTRRDDRDCCYLKDSRNSCCLDDYPVCQPQLRVLNGAHVTDICQYSGIANITVASGAFVVCNAVLALANVNGTYKETFITPSTCKDTLVNTGHEFDLEIGIQRYPIPSRIFTIYSGPNGLSYLDVNYHYQNLLTSIGECEPRACVYHDSTTSRGLDLSTCRLVSWGVSNPSSSSAGGLSVVDVALSPTGCSAIAPPSASTVTLCFKTTSGMSLSCEGDTGAPVYCMAPANGEWYVAGVTQVAANCQESTEFHVLSISSV